MTEETSQAFLFAWNPLKFSWPGLSEQSELLRNGGKVMENWSCASHKKVRPGHRAFISLVGTEPRGIFSSGYVASEPFVGKNRKGKDSNRVMLELDTLLDPAKEPILTLDIIRIGPLEKQVWAPQSSGISIKPELVKELEALWQDFLSTRKSL